MSLSVGVSTAPENNVGSSIATDSASVGVESRVVDVATATLNQAIPTAVATEDQASISALVVQETPAVDEHGLPTVPIVEEDNDPDMIRPTLPVCRQSLSPEFTARLSARDPNYMGNPNEDLRTPKQRRSDRLRFPHAKAYAEKTRAYRREFITRIVNSHSRGEGSPDEQAKTYLMTCGYEYKLERASDFMEAPEGLGSLRTDANPNERVLTCRAKTKGDDGAHLDREQLAQSEAARQLLNQVGTKRSEINAVFVKFAQADHPDFDIN
ncbi:hypothetical protein COB21_04770 [Candidatus Aerophobetes bacterium]|uniref:Uncharacterized protein n=1 Tax=Aerophobetes bacterium TaxID=2030807 RepID=A0A2A4X0B3_UNCAE|nr:MAG: hypothetical protein COB21_04770 [Candidatus Aerophobetes bacterium]